MTTLAEIKARHEASPSQYADMPQSHAAVGVLYLSARADRAWLIAECDRLHERLRLAETLIAAILAKGAGYNVDSEIEYLMREWRAGR